MSDYEFELLFSTGGEARAANRMLQAIDLYSRAEKAAEAEGNSNDHARALFYRAICLQDLSRTDEALPLFLFVAKAASTDSHTQCDAMSRALLAAATRTQFSLFTLRRLEAELSSKLLNLGLRGSRHGFLISSSYVEMIRGEFDKARQLGLEAMRVRDADSSGFPLASRISYLQTVAEACLAIRDHIGMSKVDRDAAVAQFDDENDHLNKMLISLISSRLSFFGKQMPQSIADMAEQCSTIRIWDGPFAVRVLVLAGRYEKARSRLKALAPATSNWGALRLAILEGDLELTRARYLIGLPTVDLEIATEDLADLPKQLRPHEEAIRCLKKASSIYDGAADLASLEDCRLETSYYTDTILTRQRQVAAIGGAFESYGTDRHPGQPHHGLYSTPDSSV